MVYDERLGFLQGKQMVRGANAATRMAQVATHKIVMLRCTNFVDPCSGSGHSDNHDGGHLVHPPGRGRAPTSSFRRSGGKFLWLRRLKRPRKLSRLKPKSTPRPAKSSSRTR